MEHLKYINCKFLILAKKNPPLTFIVMNFASGPRRKICYLCKQPIEVMAEKVEIQRQTGITFLVPIYEKVLILVFSSQRMFPLLRL